MIKIYPDINEAKRTILRRDLSEPELPESVRARIKQIFGETLTPEAAVARILADVRTRGDAALRDWTERIDRVALDDLQVPAQEIAAAAAGSVERKIRRTHGPPSVPSAHSSQNVR